MNRPAATLLLALVLAACTSAPSPPPGVPIDGVNAICDGGPIWPLAPTCSAAIAAALPASGFAASAIDFAEYHYGANCPPGAPCASAPPNAGYLLIHVKTGGDVLVALSADRSGRVSVVGTLH